MRRVTNTNLLFWVSDSRALTEHFLQGNVPLRHLLKTKPLIVSWWRSAFNEVNDWALSNNDDERYENFEKWQLKAKMLMEMSTHSHETTYPTFLENIRNEILCNKEMYKLVQIKKPSRFITLYGPNHLPLWWQISVKT